MSDNYYSVVYFPGLNDERIDLFRRDHDPYHNLIEEHLTLVFPVPDEIGFDAIMKHLREVLSHWAPFELRLFGLEKSWDHWLFLLVDEGNDRIKRLHDDLYGGMLGEFLRTDLEYVPHVALGLFAGRDYDPLNPRSVEYDRVRFNEALARAQILDLDYRRKIDTLTLIEVDGSLSSMRKLERLPL